MEELRLIFSPPTLAGPVAWTMKQRYISQDDFATMVATATDPQSGNPIDWNIWATFTTQYELSLKSARRAMERLHSKMSTHDLAPKKSTETILWVAEAFELKDGMHTHAILSSALKYEHIRQCWDSVTKAREYSDFGFRVHLQRYNKKLGAGHYCSKYLFKKHSDWDIILPKAKM